MVIYFSSMNKIEAFKFGTTESIGVYESTSEASKILFNFNRKKLTEIRHYLSGHKRSPLDHPIHGKIYFRIKRC